MAVSPKAEVKTKNRGEGLGGGETIFKKENTGVKFSIGKLQCGGRTGWTRKEFHGRSSDQKHKKV